MGSAGARLIAAQFAVDLVHRAVGRMPVDCRGARVDPQSGRCLQPGNGLAEYLRAHDSRFENRAAVGGRIAAIDAPAGQIDTDVAAFERANPFAARRPVPGNRLPRLRARPAAQHNHLVTLFVEVPRKDTPHLSRAAWNNDLHFRVLDPFNVSLPAAFRTAIWPLEE